jgi:hypothetical protein
MSHSDKIRLFPYGGLYPIWDPEEEISEELMQFLESENYEHARPLNTVEQAIIQGVYIYVQTCLKFFFKTEDQIPPTLSIHASYTELWWILQCFQQMVSKTRSFDFANPPDCLPIKTLFNKLAEEKGLNFPTWQFLTHAAPMHKYLTGIMKVLKHNAAFQSDIVTGWRG